MKKLHKVKDAEIIKALEDIEANLPAIPRLKILPGGKKEHEYEILSVMGSAVLKDPALLKLAEINKLTVDPTKRYQFNTGKYLFIDHKDKIRAAYCKGGTKAVHEHISKVDKDYIEYVTWANSVAPPSNNNESL